MSVQVLDLIESWSKESAIYKISGFLNVCNAGAI